MKTIKRSLLVVITILTFSCGKDDEPTNVAPVITDQPFSIDENSATGTIVGSVVATDVDNTSLTYAIVSTIPVNSTVFSVNSITGEITVNTNSLNYEGQSGYILNVEVSDGSLSSTATVQIAINNINEAPVFGENPTTFTVDKNISDTFVIGTLSATDEDGDTIKYTLSDSSASSNFELDADTGELSLRAGASIGAGSSYTFAVGVNDGVLSATQITVTVNVRFVEGDD